MTAKDPTIAELLARIEALEAAVNALQPKKPARQYACACSTAMTYCPHAAFCLEMARKYGGPRPELLLPCPEVLKR